MQEPFNLQLGWEDLTNLMVEDLTDVAHVLHRSNTKLRFYEKHCLHDTFDAYAFCHLP